MEMPDGNMMPFDVQVRPVREREEDRLDSIRDAARRDPGSAYSIALAAASEQSL